MRNISIIIPCRNEKNFISACLQSIVENDYPKDHLEVLVVDGMSEDGTRDIILELTEKYFFIKMLDNPKKITPCALNIGIKNARGEIIMRMDAHNIYPPNYISDLIAWLEKSGADNVGGICITKAANDTPKAQAIALALSHPFGVGNAYFRIGSSEPRWVDTVPFGCYRREVFERIGLFDEELVRNQDDEFNLRLKKSGGKILLIPQIVSYYFARDSLIKLWRMYWQYGYFKPLVARKIGGILTFRQIVPGIFVASLSSCLISGIFIYSTFKIFYILIGSYLITNMVTSLTAAPKINFRTKLWLMISFPILHFSYGLGYLKGIWDFWVRRRLSKAAAHIPMSR